MRPYIKKAFRLAAITVCLTLSIHTNGFASGFALIEHGAKSTAMANAFTAQADDATAAFFNPAGIVQLEGFNVCFNFYLVAPKTTFVSDTDDPALGTYPGKKTSAEDQYYFIPAIHLTYKVNEKWSVGFCQFANFGLSNKWPENWEGRYSPGGLEASITSLDLNPVVAYQPCPKLSLSFGAVFQRVNAELKNMILLGTEDVVLKTKGDDNGLGWNLGLLFFMNEHINIGLTYRSQIQHDFTGVSISSVFMNTETARFTMDLPATAFLGVAFIYDPFTFEFDIQWTQWSIGKKLQIDTEFGTVLDDPLDWEDAYSYRFGGEYRLNDAYAVRLGYVYEERCIPEENLAPFFSDSYRNYYTIGAGYKKSRYSIDMAYGYIDIRPREFNSHFGNYTRTDGTEGNLRGEFIDGCVHIANVTFGISF